MLMSYLRATIARPTVSPQPNQSEPNSAMRSNGTRRIRREVQRARVADHDRPRLGRRLGADLAEGCPRFVDEQLDHMLGAFFAERAQADRKSTRLNSSHVAISYAVFCLKKK